MKFLLLLLTGLAGLVAKAQMDSSGILVGTVLDEKNRALEGATVLLTNLDDSTSKRTTLTDKDGALQFTHIGYGFYRLRISYVGYQVLTLDSIHFRMERADFNLNDIILQPDLGSGNMDAVIIYAEKPLIQSKEGNITFNAGESALSAGSSASELLTSVPLVTKDPSGKLMVRGKEPRILIDDKPVELNLQQLQDLLESMPGSSVEKIEVMTNPPPQYASEQGGVINIVTKKGTVGLNGRLSVYGGTRGEAGTNGSFNYRKQGLSFNLNTGAGYNVFEGNGYSKRENADRSQYNNNSQYRNTSLRPNLRANLNYDLNKYNSMNLVVQYNQNDFRNRSYNRYKNFNSRGEISQLSDRSIQSRGHNYNPNISFSYQLKTKKQGESLKLISNFNYSSNYNTREFYQQYFNPDNTPNGKDSSQQQVTDNRTRGYNLRLNYDLPLTGKTFLSLGSYYNHTGSAVVADALYFRKADQGWATLDALTNSFRFQQGVTNFRGSVRQVIGENFSASTGLNAEQTRIRFDLYKTGSDTSNNYWSFLPFATLNRNWKEKLNLTLSYRRTIWRPGINELNPTIDFSDAYTIRFGNPGLIASVADNYDLVLGKTRSGFYANLGLGYNKVRDIFAQVRTLLSDGKTEITWQNISGRQEYQVSTWNGYTITRHTRVNFSASYTYNAYSDFDKRTRNYRNGGSFTSNLNTDYTLKDLYTATGSFTFNRFANPQGTVRSTLSMNIGLQAKMLKKKLTATFNMIDPFLQQENRTFTYGTNFTLESYSRTQTRNFRLSLAYNFSRKKKKNNTAAKSTLQKMMKN